jgi:hypothetical protein
MMIDVVAKRSKMSKSKGNGVGVDEVIRGVCLLSDQYQFRDLQGNLIDHRVMGVWRTPENDYRTSTSTGRKPVFLHQLDEQIPTLIKGEEQHPEEVAFWANLSKLYEEVHGCPLPKC